MSRVFIKVASGWQAFSVGEETRKSARSKEEKNEQTEVCIATQMMRMLGVGFDDHARIRVTSSDSGVGGY